MTAGLAPSPEAQTIFALTTGAVRAAVAIVRISGPAAGEILRRIAGDLPLPRRACVRALRRNDEVLDRAMVIWFPGPASFSGEDCAELHLHGGRAVIEAVCGVLVAHGARPAEPGEFSRRAFLNGKMDLLKAEAVADLVEAETEAQRRQALRQLDGALGDLYRMWADRLRTALAWQEAVIDFSDQDLPENMETQMATEIRSLIDEISVHLADGRRGERLREGFTVVVLGAPNVGKSSLLNALAARDVAIVSALPGTTRDMIEVRLNLDGMPVSLVDTAGLRETADDIEAEGIRRAKARAAVADMVVLVTEPGQPLPEVPPGAVVVTNKVDLAPARTGSLGVSARSGIGLDALRALVAARVRQNPSGSPALTRARHRSALEQARRHLQDSLRAHFADQRAEDMRLALREVGRITGAVGAEDLLDTIFAGFCIGK